MKKILLLSVCILGILALVLTGCKDKGGDAKTYTLDVADFNSAVVLVGSELIGKGEDFTSFQHT